MEVDVREEMGKSNMIVASLHCSEVLRWSSVWKNKSVTETVNSEHCFCDVCLHFKFRGFFLLTKLTYPMLEFDLKARYFEILLIIHLNNSNWRWPILDRKDSKTSCYGLENLGGKKSTKLKLKTHHLKISANAYAFLNSFSFSFLIQVTRTKVLV